MTPPMTSYAARQLDFDAAIEAKEEALRLVEEFAGDWDKAVVEQAILGHIDMYGSASANDFRDALPEITNRNLIGAMIRSLAARKITIKVGEETSTDVGTHAKPIARWARNPATTRRTACH